jgi:hypothetical protein
VRAARRETDALDWLPQHSWLAGAGAGAGREEL